MERIRRAMFRYSTLFRAWMHVTYYNTWVRFHQQRQLKYKIQTCTSHPGLHTFQIDSARFVEHHSGDCVWQEVVVTCYFTGKPDPQTGEKRNKAAFEYIQPWYESMERLGIRGIILHDGLEDAFIEKYQTELLQFRKCVLGNYSIFEERWLLYHIFIKQLPQLKTAVFSDSNDVYITSNPFVFFNDPNRIYVGRDNANRIKDSEWLYQEISEYLKESNSKVPKSYAYQWVFNAGVVGGFRKNLYFLTTKMVEKIFMAHSQYHKDMSLLNLVIHEHFYPKLSLYQYERRIVDTKDDQRACSEIIYTGYPFNSGFKEYDIESSAYFIHK